MAVEAVCLASGPSLSAEDVELVRQWRTAGRLVVVANTTFRAAPWADALFAMDRMWWVKHYPEWTKFQGKAYTTHPFKENWPIEHLTKFEPFGNSGAGAIALAIRLGATKVYLLGYDCQKTRGRSHWHGDHPKGLGNAGSLHRWPMHFGKLNGMNPNVSISNCSRETALKVFPLMRLEDALRIVPEAAGSHQENIPEAA